MPRKCSICAHPERMVIEGEVTQGESIRTVAHHRSVSNDALKRHFKAHVAVSVRRAAEQREELSTDAILDRLVSYIGTAEKLLARAEASNNLVAAGRLLKEARESAQLVGKTLGMWSDRRGDVVVNIDARVQSVLSSMGDDELVAFARQIAADRPALTQ